MKYRAEGGEQPSKVLVMGVGSEDGALVRWLGENLNIVTEAVSLPGESSPVFGKALALAGRTLRRGKRIDMRRGPFALPRGVSRLKRYALLATACVTALVSSYVFSVWAEYRVLAQERDALSEKLAQVTEQRFAEKTSSAERARELLSGGGGRKDPLARFDAFQTLAAVSAAVPTTIVHDTREFELEVDETGQIGKLHLEGTVPDLAARDLVAEALEAHDCIGELERGKTSTVPGQDKKNYTLDGQVICPGATVPKGKDKARNKRGTP
jgi:hypothetical protein